MITNTDRAFEARANGRRDSRHGDPRCARPPRRTDRAHASTVGLLHQHRKLTQNCQNSSGGHRPLPPQVARSLELNVEPRPSSGNHSVTEPPFFDKTRRDDHIPHLVPLRCLRDLLFHPVGDQCSLIFCAPARQLSPSANNSRFPCIAPKMQPHSDQTLPRIDHAQDHSTFCAFTPMRGLLRTAPINPVKADTHCCTQRIRGEATRIPLPQGKIIVSKPPGKFHQA